MRLTAVFCFSLIFFMLGCDAELKARKRAKKAFISYSEGDSLKAAERFYRLAVKYPHSNFYGRNLFNAAYIYHEIDSLKTSRALFNQILLSDLQDSRKDSSRQWGMTRANYKHFACRNLGEISLKEKKPEEALHYFQLASSQHPYLSDSSQSLKREEVLLKHQLSDTYLLLGKKDSALILSLSDAMIESPWTKHVAKNYTMELIKSNYDSETVLNELIAGFQQITRYPAFVVIPFFKYEITVVPYLTNIEKMDEAYFKSSAFYVDLYRYVHYSNKK